MKLSILIPSKNEPYLTKTLEDIKANAVTAPEILSMEDIGLGQRRTTNRLADCATGTVLMKTDAHCSFSPGFDRVLLEQIDSQTILAPILMPLTPKTWTINGKKQMSQFRFDTNFVMQHHDGKPGETMCLQGSCFVMTKENYWKWGIGTSNMPSWGGQGVELGIKAFLNAGRCVTTPDAYYGHVFRTQSEEFPYDRGESPGKQATEQLIAAYKNKSIAPLIERFNYPCDWTKAIVDKLPARSVIK